MEIYQVHIKETCPNGLGTFRVQYIGNYLTHKAQNQHGYLETNQNRETDKSTREKIYVPMPKKNDMF